MSRVSGCLRPPAPGLIRHHERGELHQICAAQPEQALHAQAFPSVLGFSELIIRLGAAALIGCAIGLDREIKGKPTGVRTLGLVALGSALAVMSSTDFAAAPPNDGSTSRAKGLSRASASWVVASFSRIVRAATFRVSPPL